LRTRPSLLIAFAGLTLLSLLGCEPDTVVTREVPRQEDPAPPEPKVRLLGAIVPHDKDTWFFKVTGKLDAAEAHQKEFEEFARSLRFDKPGGAVAWRLPAGWERLPDDPDRYATLRVGPKEAKLELTVHRYGDAEQMRSVFQNVARWGQREVGVKVREDDLRNYVRRDKTAGDVAFYFVDMKGPGGNKPSMRPGAPNPHAPPEKPTYTVPEGWKEVEAGGGPFAPLVALTVEQGGSSARATISQSGGNGGGLLMNVNRWRRQVGLSEIDQDQLDDARQGGFLKSITVAGTTADYVDLSGPGKDFEHILAVVVKRGDATWFFKLQGPRELVGRQKAAFEKFVGSVKFDGGNGG
jgi:hypothetical protein